MKILVSACLLGLECRYNAESRPDARVLALAERHSLIPVCPEQLGGLATPREPAELCGGRVLTRSGADVTEPFERGAAGALKLAETLGCGCAVLKSRSPSCGRGRIHDGSFSSALVPGDGLTARKLLDAGIRVYTEDDCVEIDRA